eukprot:TRINITY_DN809_c1_g1_i1.p3 TRINITY_DN809_c1_g1~~TRINITY_DN809_c1_g1_i1.p3  ORF type:complete len:146 (-),score=23.74 TRINITY_DN809_c1_g1_i1:40-477(-)
MPGNPTGASCFGSIPASEGSFALFPPAPIAPRLMACVALETAPPEKAEFPPSPLSTTLEKVTYGACAGGGRCARAGGALLNCRSGIRHRDGCVSTAQPDGGRGGGGAAAAATAAAVARGRSSPPPAADFVDSLNAGIDHRIRMCV